MNENKIGEILSDHIHEINIISEYEKRVIENIINCRTSKMGGRVECCSHCGHEIILYNSCRNRNCPNCQGSKIIKWLNKNLTDTLPANYFHCVFTVPEELKDLFLHNKKQCYNILFKSVSKTLIHTVGKRLKVKPGFFSILHTWDQKLNSHPHIHCVIAGGGLSSSKTNWIEIKNKNYFLPVKILSKVFKGKLLFYLNKALRKELLKVDKNTFLSTCNAASKKDWVVFIKKPKGGTKGVLKYLSKYTHRVGISNKRIINYDGKTVTFSYRDRRDGNKKKELTIPAILFIKKFILHIIPKRFVKIRFYGFMVNRFKKNLIDLCRMLILKDTDVTEHILPELSLIPYIDYSICPVCKQGKMVVESLIKSG